MRGRAFGPFHLCVFATAWCARQAVAMRIVPSLVVPENVRTLTSKRPGPHPPLRRWEASAGSGGRCESFMERFLRAEAAQRTLIGSWNCIGSPEVTEVLADAGMDFICLDMEHSSMGLETVAHNIRAAQAAMSPPVVRVPGQGPGKPNLKEIMRVLDLGASAVIVPGALSKEDVEAVMAAGAFPKPVSQADGAASAARDGIRGANPFVRAGRHGLIPPSDYHRKSNEETVIIPLLETPAAFEQLPEIMQVEGIKVVAFGPFDLSVAMGFDGVRTSEVEACLMKGVEVARQYGVRPMLPVLDLTAESTGETLKRWEDKGVRLFTVGVDKALLGRAAKGFLDACRR